MAKIVVPSGMARAAWDAMDIHARVHGDAVGCVVGSMCSLDCGLTAALLWLSKNPPEFSEAQHAASHKYHDGHSWPEMRYPFTIAFLAPEEEIEDLLAATEGIALGSGKQHNAAVLEAYRRGKAAR